MESRLSTLRTLDISPYSLSRRFLFVPFNILDLSLGNAGNLHLLQPSPEICTFQSFRSVCLSAVFARGLQCSILASIVLFHNVLVYEEPQLFNNNVQSKLLVFGFL